MADLLQETEDIPEKYPDFPALVCQRIEAYTRVRYSQRLVTWVIEAREDENWVPPLGPVVSYTSEKWEAGAWVASTLVDGPVGLCMPSDGTFRITAQVGGGKMPASVSEAHERLAKYVSAIQRTPGERLAMRQMSQNSYQQRPIRQTPAQDSVRVQEVDGSAEYYANWPARALQLSGAADLLRPYRRQK